MRVRCVRLLDSRGRPTDRSTWARVGETYEVLSIVCEEGKNKLRLIGDEPVPALFELEMFEVVSSDISRTWVATSPRPGCLVIGPEPWAQAGFWEAFFDQEPNAVACFDEERRKILDGQREP